MPERVMPEEADAAQRLLSFMHQYGDRVAVWAECGVPIVELCQEHAAANDCRMAASRRAKGVRELQRAGVASVVELVRAMLGDSVLSPQESA